MNVGIIGIRGFGGTYFSTLQKRPDVRVQAICDVDEPALRKAAATHGVPHRFTDYRRMLALPDLEAVFIAVPHYLHHPITMAALNASKHALCEKPFSMSAAHAQEMAATARAKGLVLSCHYNFRQKPYVKILRHIVQSGMVGQVYQASVRWIARWTGFMFDQRTNWRLQGEKAGGGIWIGRGCHTLDCLWHILGYPDIHSVLACTHNRLTRTDVDDFTLAVLRLAGGLTVNIQCSYVAHSPQSSNERLEFEFYGTAGGASYLQIDAEPGNVLVGRLDMASGKWEDRTASLDVTKLSAAPPVTIIDDFLDSVAQKREPFVTAEGAAYLTKVLEAGYESARTGREVAVGRCVKA